MSDQEPVADVPDTMTPVMQEVIRNKVNLCTSEVQASLEKYDCVLVPERIESPDPMTLGAVSIRYHVRVLYAGKPTEG